MSSTQGYKLPYNFWSLLSVFLISVVMIGLQLFLMRALSVTRYYHFSYLVISTALLGFGASGTLLSFWYDWIKERAYHLLHIGFLLFLIAVPTSYLLAQQLPINIQYILLDSHQQLLMLVYNFLMFIPFFLGATLIGFFITYFKRSVSQVYGANLLGSGIGGVLALIIMFVVPPVQLPLQMVIFVFLSYLAWLASNYRQDKQILHSFHIYGYLGLGLFITVLGVAYQAEPHIDPHKDLANLQRLQNQGDARHLIQRYGPRGQIDIYDSPATHYTLFAGLQTRTNPPPQLSLLLDGSTIGTIFQVDSVNQTRILGQTPQSLPYRLHGDSAQVLILGASGGTNIWLAKQYNAHQITAVQTNPQLVDLLQNKLNTASGNVFNKSDVKVVTQSPRHFLEQTDQKFDIIQFARAETMASGSSGLQSLSENYLLTIEAVREAYKLLSTDGYLTITRGIETPPRDNIKIFALWAEAAKSSDTEPSDLLLQSRNYLAVNTMLSRSSISDTTIRTYRAQTDSLLMDNDYYPGIRPGTDPVYNKIGGPDEAGYSWFFHAAQQILKGNAADFLDDWVYQVRPPSDNQPYFSNFFKWSSLDRFQKTYGKFWLQKIELGYVVLVITLIEISIIAFILIILPLIIRQSRLLFSGYTFKTLVYFTATGIGFIFLEIVFIQKCSRFLGDPIYSTGAALTSMLVFAGLGSITQKFVSLHRTKKVVWAGISLIILTGLYMIVLDPLFELFSDLPTFLRFLITCLLIFPPAFSLGWFFPIGISLLDNYAPSLIPWAWGIDGFTSVAGAPLAVLLSMSFGFNVVLLIGLIFYLFLMLTMPFWQ